MGRLTLALAVPFDALQSRWESPRTQHRVGGFLVAAFLAALAAIEANRRGLLPAPLASGLPTNHFYAVDVAFTLLLLFETVALVFSLAHSVANSVGKQFEIFSLILLRQAFKEFTAVPEPVDWIQVGRAVPHMLADAGGALAVFVALGVFYRLQHHVPITPDARERSSFVSAKKAVAVLLLGAFTVVGAFDVWASLAGEESASFFEVVYTVLILGDILVVLLSLRYSSTYHVVFRNSGFAAATVFMRLALTAPPYVNAALGLAACLLALGVTWAYNAFAAIAPVAQAPAAAPE